MKHLTLTHSTILFEETLTITSNEHEPHVTQLLAKREYKPLPFLSIFLLFWFLLFLPIQYLLGPVAASIIVTLKTVIAALFVSGLFYLNKINLESRKIPYGKSMVLVDAKNKTLKIMPEGDEIEFAEMEKVIKSDSVRHHGLRGIFYKHNGIKLIGKTFEKTLFKNNFLDAQQIDAAAKTIRECCDL